MFKLCNICYIIRSIKQAQATDSESVLDSVRPSRAELRVNAGPCHYDSDWQAVLLLALALAQPEAGSTVTARAVTHAAAEVGGQGAVSGVGSPGQRLTGRHYAAACSAAAELEPAKFERAGGGASWGRRAAASGWATAADRRPP